MFPSLAYVPQNTLWPPGGMQRSGTGAGMGTGSGTDTGTGTGSGTGTGTAGTGTGTGSGTGTGTGMGTVHYLGRIVWYKFSSQSSSVSSSLQPVS